ncbi:MAG: hypothetical protein BMS9Abin18_1265 [Zetaproteobacteria bacterium]|nr:MAG: hypothetical protein BMS9Abin18_1265 [Zetaproteobacteria bacterium]
MKTLMITSITALFAVAFLGLATTVVAQTNWTHYNGHPDFEPTELPNGAIVNADETMRVMPLFRGVKEARAMPVTDNVWMIFGYLYGSVIIDTPEGLIVVGTGEHKDDGTAFRKIIRRDVNDKPIIAVFYDHAHYSKGTRTLLDGDNAMIIAHPDHNEIMRRSGEIANPYIEEMLPHLDARSDIQFGTHLPKTGPDAATPGTTLQLGQESAWLPATRTPKDGETITIAGVKIQVFHAVTDTEDTITLWLPKQKIIIDNVMWAVFPNLYTIRGDRYRSPEEWMSAIRQIRDLEPEFVLDVGGGAVPLVGKENIRETANALLDSIAFLYDQSIRLTNMGVQPKEIRHNIKLPESVKKSTYVNEMYGQFDTYTEAFPVYNHGWFSGYSEDLHSLPKAEYARRFVAIAGGPGAVLKAHKVAMAKGEFLWAKDLAANLYYSDRSNKTYRQALADVFRKLASYVPGSAPRAFYLAGALSLEGNKNITLGEVQTADWVKADLSRAVNALRTRIDPNKAMGIESVLVFDIDGSISALHIRNSIAEFIPEPAKHYQSPDATLKARSDTFAAYFRGEIGSSELVAQSKTSGDVEKLLAVFDRYVRIPMYPYTERGEN